MFDQLGPDDELTKKLFSEGYKDIFDNINSGIAIYRGVNNGEDFIFVDINKAGSKFSKVEKTDVFGKSVTDVFPGIKDMGLFAVFQDVWYTGKAMDFPLTKYIDERITQWVQNHVFKLYDEFIVAIYDDKTDQKLSEMKLRARIMELEKKIEDLEGSK